MGMRMGMGRRVRKVLSPMTSTPFPIVMLPHLVRTWWNVSLRITLRPSPMMMSSFRVVEVAAGRCHTLFRIADGSVYACGQNAVGQAGLGPGAIGGNCELPTCVAVVDDGSESVLTYH